MGVYFSNYLRIRCPLAGCLGGASSRTNLFVHFAHCHVWDTIVTLEEVSRPYPRCPKYNMFVPQKALNVWNLTNVLCRRGMESKCHRLAEEEAREGKERAITVYRFLLSQVTSFKYLERVLAAEENSWP